MITHTAIASPVTATNAPIAADSIDIESSSPIGSSAAAAAGLGEGAFGAAAALGDADLGEVARGEALAGDLAGVDLAGDLAARFFPEPGVDDQSPAGPSPNPSFWPSRVGVEVFLRGRARVGVDLACAQGTRVNGVTACQVRNWPGPCCAPWLVMTGGGARERRRHFPL